MIFITVRSKIHGSLQNYLERDTGHCSFSAELFSKGFISEAVTTYNLIFDEFMTRIKQFSDAMQLAEHYKKFLDCLKCNGGPSKDVIDNLFSEWKTIESQSKS